MVGLTTEEKIENLLKFIKAYIKKEIPGAKVVVNPDSLDDWIEVKFPKGMKVKGGEIK